MHSLRSRITLLTICVTIAAVVIVTTLSVLFIIKSEQREGEQTLLLMCETGERNLDYYYVLLFSPEDGYIIVVCGTSDMETIEHVARELQIKKTGKMLSSADFEQNCVFIDVGQG